MSQDNYLNLERLKQFLDKLKTVFVSKEEIRDRDSADNTVTFASSDTADPSAWTDVAVLKSGESHKSLARKASAMFQNVRYLRKLYENLKADDIGAFPDVTVVNIKGKDLDDYTKSGIYYFPTNGIPTNSPSGTAGWLFVITGSVSGYVRQVWFQFGTFNKDHGTYVRRSDDVNASSWSVWRQYITDAGGTMTGNLVMKNVTLDDGVNTRTVMTAYDDGDGDINLGSELVIGGNGNTFIGAGESPSNLRNALMTGENVTADEYQRTAERLYLSSDIGMYFFAGCQNVAARKGMCLASNGILYPVRDGDITLGRDGNRFKGACFSGTVTAETFSGNAASATKLQTARTIDGISFDGSGSIRHYATCSTAAATAAKAAALTGFVLETGAEITIKFSTTNTASNPTLNVNATGAKAIWYNGAAVPAGYLRANLPLRFVFDGTYWQMAGYVDTNTKYSTMTGASAGAAGKAGLVPAPAAGAQGKYLRGDGTWQTPPDTTYTAAAAAPKAAGTAAAGTSAKYAREDHIHPLQTAVSGNAGTATKLKTSRKIGNASFDGTANITLAQIGAAAEGHDHADKVAVVGGHTIGLKWNDTYFSMLVDNVEFSPVLIGGLYNNAILGIVGIALGSFYSETATYIYTENGNVNFRYKDQKSGVMQYTDIDKLVRAATGGHTHNYLPITGGILQGHLNVNADNTWIFGGEQTNLLNVYTRNIEASTGHLFIKAKMSDGSNAKVNIQANNGLYVNKYNVQGNLQYAPVTASSFNAPSSRKVKENICSMTDDEARKVLELDVVTFDYIEKAGGKKDQRGLIAEDVYKVIPSAVSMPDNYNENNENITDVPGIDYSRFVPYLIKMVQILYDLHQEQDKKISAEEDKIQELTARLEAIERRLDLV